MVKGIRNIYIVPCKTETELNMEMTVSVTLSLPHPYLFFLKLLLTEIHWEKPWAGGSQQEGNYDRCFRLQILSECSLQNADKLFIKMHQKILLNYNSKNTKIRRKPNRNEVITEEKIILDEKKNKKTKKTKKKKK